MKEFGLHFRYRSAMNELETVGLVCSETSQAKAKEFGKRLAAQHSQAERGPGGVWFIGLESAEWARAAGGQLP